MPDSEIAKLLPFKKESQSTDEALLSPEGEAEEEEAEETEEVEDGEEAAEATEEVEAEEVEDGEEAAEATEEVEAEEVEGEEETAEETGKSVKPDSSETATREQESSPTEEMAAVKSSGSTGELTQPDSMTAEEEEEIEEVSRELQAALGDQATEDPDPALLLAPGDTTITFTTIMPVAYSANDIKVLSFGLDVELDANKSAKLVRKATPVFEKIMIQTVEKFLSEKLKKDKKFYNDILYVREKLQKRLTLAFNKNLQGGRVRKVKFKEFLVQ